MSIQHLQDFQWYDGIRVCACLVSLYCAVTMIRRIIKRRNRLNTRTLDFKYAMAAWSIAGIAIPLQSMLLDLPFTPSVVCVVAATLVTGKGIHEKGPWGSSDD